MPQYEVLIPRSEPHGADLTLLVDVRQDGVGVTEPKNGRVFSVRELKSEAVKPAKAAPAVPKPPPTPQKPDIMSELFHSSGQMYEHKTAKAAAEFVLGLAMKSIKAESGAVYISSINRQDLHVVAASGPAAADLKDARVAMGHGTVGLAAQEGVAIAAGSGEACSPAQQDGRVYGAIQLLHKKDAFAADDMGALDYLAAQFAEYLVNTGQTDA